MKQLITMQTNLKISHSLKVPERVAILKGRELIKNLKVKYLHQKNKFKYLNLKTFHFRMQLRRIMEVDLYMKQEHFQTQENKSNSSNRKN